MTGCDIGFVGIRLAEKLHDALVFSDEIRYDLGFTDMLEIQLMHAWWKPADWGGERSPAGGFVHTSDKNDRWLSVEDLRQMIEEK